MKKIHLLFLVLVFSCQTNNVQKEQVVLDNEDSEEITSKIAMNIYFAIFI